MTGWPPTRGIPPDSDFAKADAGIADIASATTEITSLFMVNYSYSLNSATDTGRLKLKQCLTFLVTYVPSGKRVKNCPDIGQFLVSARQLTALEQCNQRLAPCNVSRVETGRQGAI